MLAKHFFCGRRHQHRAGLASTAQRLHDPTQLQQTWRSLDSSERHS
jgi:hypothetical protein